MALTRSDFEWVMPDTDPGARTMEDDNNPVWSLWADLTGMPWAERNGFPFALIGTNMSHHRAVTMALRLYEIWGTGSLGVTSKF